MRLCLLAVFLASTSASPHFRILRDERYLDHDSGNFKHGYVTENGIVAAEQQEGEFRRGYYEYVNSDGSKRRVDWEAGPGIGFRILSGSKLPLPVTDVEKTEEVRKEDALALRQMQIELAKMIAKNEELHGVSRVVKTALVPLVAVNEPSVKSTRSASIDVGTSFATDAYRNIRPEERIAFQNMQLQLAGMVLELKALNEKSGSKTISHILTNLPVSNPHNPKDDIAHRKMIEQLAAMIEEQRRALLTGTTTTTTQLETETNFDFEHHTEDHTTGDFDHTTGDFEHTTETFENHENFENHNNFGENFDFGTTENFDHHTDGFSGDLEASVIESPATYTFGAEVRDADAIAMAEQRYKLSQLVKYNCDTHGHC